MAVFCCPNYARPSWKSKLCNGNSSPPPCKLLDTSSYLATINSQQSCHGCLPATVKHISHRKYWILMKNNIRGREWSFYTLDLLLWLNGPSWNEIGHSNEINEKTEYGKFDQLTFVLGHSELAQANGIEGIYVALLLLFLAIGYRFWQRRFLHSIF
jgi:hypothetical protein